MTPVFKVRYDHGSPETTQIGDAFEHEGATWLVALYNEPWSSGWTTPARIVRIDQFELRAAIPNLETDVRAVLVALHSDYDSLEVAG
jgi:hypothetical protein